MKLLVLFLLSVHQVGQYPESDRTGALLRDVACTWMNRPSGMGGGTERNYDRWSRFLRTKQKLRIGGIFPMRGNKFRAPELLPGGS